MRQLVLSLLLFILPGCVMLPAEPAARHRWVQRHGGVMHGEQTRRAHAILQRLTSLLDAPTISIAVLDSAAASAYAWPDGRLYVTRGLLLCLDDDELAAAIAHELGHLLVDGHMPSPVSLHGCADGIADPEMRADAAGQRLLDLAGLPPATMARMLRKLPAGSARCQAAIARRIEILQTDY
jgi:predicted Zn-dependent protease